MRSKLIICASGIPLLVLAMLPVVRPRTEAPTADVSSANKRPATETVTPRTHPRIVQTENKSASGDVRSISIQSSEATHKIDPQARASELMDLAMNNDSASL